MANELATTIARVASDIALVIDDQGVIQSVAQGALPLTPRPGEWVGRRWADVASKGTRGKIDLLLDEVRAAGVTQRREVNHPGASGEDIPVAWTAIRLGTSGPFIAVGRDLRVVAAIQQKYVDAQQELEREYWRRLQSEQRYRMLFHVARDAVLVVDALGLEIIDANEAAARLLDRDVALLAGAALADLLPPATRAPITGLLARARATQRAGEMRLRLRADTGPFDVSATPIRVGDRLQLLVQARHAAPPPGDGTGADRPAPALEAAPMAVAVTDSAGRVLMANETFASLVGCRDESSVQGTTLQALFGDVGQACTSLLTRVLEQGLVTRVPLLLRAGAHAVMVEATAAMLADGEQDRIGLTLQAPSAARATVAAPVWSETDPDLTASLDDIVGRLGQAPIDDLLGDAVDAIEHHLIDRALQRCAGDTGAAARMLGMTPMSLVLRLQRLASPWPRPDDGDPPPSIN